MSYSFPVFAFDPHKVWSEVPTAPQSTVDVVRAVSALTLVLAYMMTGNKFRGSYENYTIEELDAELHKFCRWHSLDPNLIVSWAESLLLPPTYQAELDGVIETRMPTLGFRMHEYQRQTAGWIASRLGSILALSCGTGKSVTAWAGVLAAVRSGRCKGNRCHIICPVNAMGQWVPYAEYLQKEFDDVQILSVDSVHKYVAFPKVGGALIIDEAHNIGQTERRRTICTFEMRLGYEWCTCLTGTLLHTGPEKVLAIQDTALPGLSRFADKWRFGEVFKCIIQKKAGKRMRSALAMPAGDAFEPFVAYLNRGTRSLSFESPEVKAANAIPGQTKHTIDTWPEPDWVKTLRAAEREKTIKRFYAAEGRKPTEAEIGNESNLFWLPDCDWRWSLGATAVAVMHELEELEKLGLDGDREPIPERLDFSGDEDEGPTLPTFAKVRMEASREGRIDRCVERYVVDGVSTYRWLYAPGSDMLKPAPGPKIREVMRWVDENPGEPALIASVSSLSKQFVIDELTKRGKTFGVIDGTVPAKKRDELKEQFQAGQLDFMVVQQKAGSESITLTRACNSFLIDHSWSPIVYTQLLARTCRTSQTRQCEHYDLVFGQLQATIVRTLQRGEAFDIRVRSQLEQMVRESLSIMQVNPAS